MGLGLWLSILVWFMTSCIGRLEYVRSTPSLAQWLPRLPELEEILYTKFPNKVFLSASPSLFPILWMAFLGPRVKLSCFATFVVWSWCCLFEQNDYYNMMKGPVEPQLQFAIMTLSAQNQQHPQMSGQAVHMSQGSGIGAVAGVDGTNGIRQHQLMQYMTAMSEVDQQFVMLRTAMREKM